MFVFILLALAVHAFGKEKVCDKIDLKKRVYLDQPKTELPYAPAAGRIFVGQTGGESCKMSVQCRNVVLNLQKNDFAKNLNDIADNFLIGGDGNVYEGRGWQKKNQRYNGDYQKALSVIFIGDFDGKNVTEEMAETAFKLIQCGVSKGKIQYYASIYTYADLNCALKNDANGVQNEVEKWFRYAAGGSLVKC